MISALTGGRLWAAVKICCRLEAKGLNAIKAKERENLLVCMEGRTK